MIWKFEWTKSNRWFGYITLIYYRNCIYIKKRGNLVDNKGISQNCSHYALHVKYSNSVYGLIEWLSFDFEIYYDLLKYTYFTWQHICCIVLLKLNEKFGSRRAKFDAKKVNCLMIRVLSGIFLKKHFIRFSFYICI